MVDIQFAHKTRNALALPVALFMLAMIYWLDVILPPYVSFTAYYLAPVLLAAWYLNERSAYAIAILAVAANIHNVALLGSSHDSYWFGIYEIASTSFMYGAFLYITLLVRKQVVQLQDKSHLLGRLAFHDRMTDLPNRSLFFDRLALAIAKAKRTKHKVAILFLDLDSFKPVNDLYGHNAGDEVLKTTAKRLVACVRETDTVARIGGDEFAIVLSQLKDTANVSGIAEKILRAAAEPIHLGNGQQHTIGISIGISMFPENGAEIDRLLANADDAMYESKRNGKLRYTFSRETALEQKNHEKWMVYDGTVGVAEIDLQHRQLIHQANQLNDAVRDDKPPEIIDRLLNDLIAHAKFHFSAEKRLMFQYKFPDEKQHCREHAYLIEEITFIKNQLEEGGELMALQTIKDWLVNHIEHSDKALGAYLKQCGVK